MELTMKLPITTSRVRGRGYKMEKELTGKDIIKLLGYNKIQPIALSPSTQKDIDDVGNHFSDWLEEELLKAYEES